MPSPSPTLAVGNAGILGALGQKIRTQRKALGVSATSTAEAAGISRVTLHRIEKGEPSITLGAYLNVLAALGLELDVQLPKAPSSAAQSVVTKGWIPARVSLSEYPQLKKLAWQLSGIDTLTPTEALGIYERNWRHMDQQALEPAEQDLIDALRLALQNDKPHV